MANYGFQDKTVALTLKQVALERRTRPDVASRIEQDGYPFDGLTLVHFKINGAHSLGAVLDCTLGEWDPGLHDHTYTGDAAKCIDRRKNVPTSSDNATGVGYALPSTDHGSIIYILDLDCRGVT